MYGVAPDKPEPWTLVGTTLAFVIYIRLSAGSDL